ncbi:hypothetical protein A0130_09855 [Leifsonia xyli]|nr:hypothetical protein A0130_09855 [Leifsonia xyli]
MVATVLYWNPETIEARRSELIAEAGLSIEELRTRDANYTLDPSTQAVLRELEDLEFLATRSAD